MTIQQGAQVVDLYLSQNNFGGQWLSLGTYNFNAGNVSLLLDSSGASGTTITAVTGAVRFASSGEDISPFVTGSTLAPVGSQGDFYTELSGIWRDSTSANPIGGSNRLSDSADADAMYSDLPIALGDYLLELSWAEGGNRTPNAILTVIDANGVTHVINGIDQRVAAFGDTELALQNLALRQQLAVLKHEQNRPRLRKAGRILMRKYAA